MGIYKKFKTTILPNLNHLYKSKIRVCRCCLKKSLIVSLSEGDELKICVRCRANLRYEMLAEYIRKYYENLNQLEILELDPNSPIKPLLSKGRKYVRTFYSSDRAMQGKLGTSNARCEDITRLTFPDESFDLIISSDVLEHVANIEDAFRETERVLRPGGAHLFTVPPRNKTRKRAESSNGKTRFLLKPEYHKDPLSPNGILVYWDFGPDMETIFSTKNLKIKIVDGPKGKDARVLWKAEKKFS